MLAVMVGRVIDEPVSEEAGQLVRERFAFSGVCACGLELATPPRRARREQWRTGDLIEHIYRHAEGCAGGEHVLYDVRFTKPQREGSL